MTYKEAVELSILKWKYIVDHDGDICDLYDEIPKLNTLKFGCGLCEFNCLAGSRGPDCYSCDLYKLDGNKTCNTYGSAFNIWAKRRDKDSAKAVLNLILRISIMAKNDPLRKIDDKIYELSLKISELVKLRKKLCSGEDMKNSKSPVEVEEKLEWQIADLFSKIDRLLMQKCEIKRTLK